MGSDAQASSEMITYVNYPAGAPGLHNGHHWR
ncbi:hypothetical protein QFZ76_007641 [Streptomyces sp. V4I2]|nr:hypothetical protein [Streptomyces sp. V4I2]